MNGSSGLTSTSSVRSGISSRTSMNGYRELAKTRNCESTCRSTDDGCTHAGSNGSIVMRPDSMCARMSRSDRIIRAMLPGVRNLDPAVERLQGVALIDRPSGRRHPFGQIRGEPGDLERGPCVQQHHVAAGPYLPAEDAACEVRRLGRVPAPQVARPCAREPDAPR